MDSEIDTLTSRTKDCSKKKLPWKLSFSYGRALQQPSLSLWKGKKENVKNAQDALYLRSKLNSNATLGNYSSNDEKKMPC